jgi:5'-3' exonuclease
MNSKISKKLVLINGSAIIHRAYHALPPLTLLVAESNPKNKERMIWLVLQLLKK